MKKTILTPKTAQELSNWVKLLKEAEAEYRLIPFGNKPSRIELDADVAEEVLGIETKKPMSIAAKIGIGFAAFCGFSFLASMIMVGLTDTPDTPAKPAYTYDYTQIMDKTKAELVAVFGEPVNEFEYKEDCPTGGCGALDFKDGLAVTLRDGKAYRFEFTTKDAKANKLLREIGLDSDQEPDVQNETATRWALVDGLDVTVLTTNDEFSYSVKQLNEKEIKAAERQRKIAAIFDAWSGEVPALRESIKKSMNDPSSYDHVETRYDDSGDGNTFPVECAFRGKNAFGGVVLNKVRATVDLDGNVLDMKMVD